MLNQLRDLTISESRAVGIAGGYIGDEGGHFRGVNKLYYLEMVKIVIQICRKKELPEPIILQPPKTNVAFTDLYYETQKDLVTIITRPDYSLRICEDY